MQKGTEYVKGLAPGSERSETAERSRGSDGREKKGLEVSAVRLSVSGTGGCGGRRNAAGTHGRRFRF